MWNQFCERPFITKWGLLLFRPHVDGVTIRNSSEEAGGKEKERDEDFVEKLCVKPNPVDECWSDGFPLILLILHTNSVGI